MPPATSQPPLAQWARPHKEHPGGSGTVRLRPTITSNDSYGRFLRRIATPRQRSHARWTIGPWLAGYRLGLVSAAQLRRRATQAAFAGRDAAEIAHRGECFARDELPAMLRPDMMQRIDRHRAQGHRLVLVSASLDLYLAPWCRLHGMELLCNRLDARDGQLTGRYNGHDIGTDKAEAIRAHCGDLSRHARIHAHGDSREDRPMLALAHERWYRGRRIA